MIPVNGSTDAYSKVQDNPGSASFKQLQVALLVLSLNDRNSLLDPTSCDLACDRYVYLRIF